LYCCGIVWHRRHPVNRIVGIVEKITMKQRAKTNSLPGNGEVVAFLCWILKGLGQRPIEYEKPYLIG